MSLPYLEVAVGFIVLVYVFETYLDVRQYGKSKETQRPSQLTAIVDQTTFDKAQVYAKDKLAFGFFESFVGEIKSVSTLLLFLFPLMWKLAGDVLTWAELPTSEIAQSLVFMLLSWAIDLVLDLPFQLYRTFVIEEKHGFNKQTLGLFFTDMIKTILLTLVIGGPFLAGLIYVIQWGGESFYLYVWAFVTAVQLVMIALYPNVIQPLFNKVVPMEDSPLKKKIEALADQLKFPLKKLYVIDGSKRSSHSNAYFYGFFKNKHIVLYDTLINQMNEEEVVSVLAHELGHWSLNHTMKKLVVIEVHLFILFFIFGQFLNDTALYESFGFFDSKPTIVGLILFSIVYSPIEHTIGFFMNMLSRAFEFEADAFAKNLGQGTELRNGLIKLQKENLGNLNPDSWYSTYHYSHPPLVERLNALSTTKKEQ